MVLKMNSIAVKIKNVFRSISKLTLSLFIAGVAILTVAHLYSTISEISEKKQNEKYAVVKNWEDDLKRLHLKVIAKTKWVNGDLLLMIAIDGYPDFLRDSTLRQQNIDKGFWFRFLDKDGFNIKNIFIPLSEFTVKVNRDGTRIGLKAQTSQPIDISSYKEFSAFNVSWTFDTSALKSGPAIPDIAQHEAGGLKDHCEPDISKKERLSRLAQYGRVRQTGGEAFEAGGHQVFFSLARDGYLLSCN